VLARRISVARISVMSEEGRPYLPPLRLAYGGWRDGDRESVSPKTTRGGGGTVDFVSPSAAPPGCLPASVMASPGRGTDDMPTPPVLDVLLVRHDRQPSSPPPLISFQERRPSVRQGWLDGMKLVVIFFFFPSQTSSFHSLCCSLMMLVGAGSGRLVRWRPLSPCVRGPITLGCAIHPISDGVGGDSVRV
jgi:hypothetical protein